MRIALLLMISLMTTTSWGKKAEKGILPELQIKSTDSEEDNQKKAVQTEVLITKTEAAAIASLQKIIAKRKGAPDEPDLYFRLAELYMRRAKSGRFFDLNRDNQKALSIAPPIIREESSAKNLKQAVEIFLKIEKSFPKFYAMDAVFFNHAFSRQQLKDNNTAQQYYLKLIEKHPQSVLLPDAHLAVGEMNYDLQRYNMALEHFLAIEAFPKSKVYTYAIYKSAWTYYNLQQTDQGMEKLKFVANYFHPDGENAKTTKPQYNLRPEAIRDLAIFFSDHRSSEEAYPYFSKICTEQEIGDSLLTLATIYDAHSRQKDLNLVLNEFIKKKSDSPSRVRAYISLINANETLKNRKDVIAHLQAASDVCQIKSKWREKNPTQATDHCDGELTRTNLELAKKWWEIWLKNKQHKDFADLTQEAFRIYLERENPKQPDSKSRFAYAELLFQREKYREASVQYEKVSTTTVDPSILHDSSYSALVSLEKASLVKKESKDNDEMLRLSAAYLEKNPKGKYLDQVNFKIGFIYYEQKKFDLAEKQLKPMANEKSKSTGNNEFKRKSEDILLDILNERKDFEGIIKLTTALIQTNSEGDRKSQLTKLLEEADYSFIQIQNKKAKPFEAAMRLRNFYLAHSNSPLAKDALWQALSLGYSSGRIVDGADWAKEYHQRFKDDPKAIDALKEAARAYAEAGMLQTSADTLELVACLPNAKLSAKEKTEFHETAAEFYLLEGQTKQSKALFENSLAEKQTKDHGPILIKLLQLSKGNESSPEYVKLENRILQAGFEPYASDIQLKRVQSILDLKKYTEAFNQAKNIVGGNGSENTKAKARLIQAAVLEQELFSQPMKTSLDRLPAVLSLKTEKLDKAQTAYLNAAKMAKDPLLQIQALEGLNRCYKNYVESVHTGQVKGELQDEEKKALETELGKITAPFKEKSEETTKKLASLNQEFNRAMTTKDGNRKPAEQNIAQQKIPDAYLPELNDSENLKSFARAQSMNPICTEKDLSSEESIVKVQQRINFCLLASRLDSAQKWIDRLARLQPKGALPLFYGSVLAEKRGLQDKALYLSEVSLKRADGVAYLYYQKARLLLKSQEQASAQEAFKRAHDLKLKTTELEAMFSPEKKSGGGA